MDSTYQRINVTTVLFTPTTTVVGNISVPPVLPYLKVEITPTEDGNNIDGIKVLYVTKQGRLNEEISEENIFRTLTLNIKGEDRSLYNKVTKYMRELSSEEVTVVVNEYTKYISDGVILDGFIAGIASYMAFLVLNDNGVFANQMPFQFRVVNNIESGLSVTSNMFQYLNIAMTSLCLVSEGILLQLVKFIQTFINLWDPVFETGPNITITDQSRLAMEVIAGLSQSVSKSIAQNREINKKIMEKLESIEMRMEHRIDNGNMKISKQVDNRKNEYSSMECDLWEDILPDKLLVAGLETIKDNKTEYVYPAETFQRKDIRHENFYRTDIRKKNRTRWILRKSHL